MDIPGKTLYYICRWCQGQTRWCWRHCPSRRLLVKRTRRGSTYPNPEGLVSKKGLDEQGKNASKTKWVQNTEDAKDAIPPCCVVSIFDVREYARVRRIVASSCTRAFMIWRKRRNPHWTGKDDLSSRDTRLGGCRSSFQISTLCKLWELWTSNAVGWRDPYRTWGYG